MQIKTTTRYHLTLFRMAIIKKSTNNKCQRGCGEKEMLLHSWWECKLIQPLWRTVLRFLKKLKIELPYNTKVPLLGLHSEKTKIQKDICTPMFIGLLFTIARTWPLTHKRAGSSCYSLGQQNNTILLHLMQISELFYKHYNCQQRVFRANCMMTRLQP